MHHHRHHQPDSLAGELARERERERERESIVVMIIMRNEDMAMDSQVPNHHHHSRDPQTAYNYHPYFVCAGTGRKDEGGGSACSAAMAISPCTNKNYSIPSIGPYLDSHFTARDQSPNSNQTNRARTNLFPFEIPCFYELLH
ncbi:unnamed protein product [Linum trigynum]|uniref:Uncharacterized protein n=1 Tax=Linum trigynum TaxID=586398 RepID=A0AAV2DHF6_9ROSI